MGTLPLQAKKCLTFWPERIANTIMTTALLFLSPIFYAANSIPEKFRVIMHCNPLTPIIEQTRGILFWNTPPDPMMLLFCYLVSAAVACLGFAWFQKTRKGFADVL